LVARQTSWNAYRFAEMRRKLLAALPPPLAVFALSSDDRTQTLETTMRGIHGRFARYIWALPTSAVGLCIGVTALISGGRMQWIDGVLEFHGGFVAYFLRHMTLLEGGASAMTLGHVVLGCSEFDLQRTREHERVHVRQCERWGPLFIPAYCLASAWIFCRGGDAYEDNPFEREAYAKAA
jgi:hypothetical protein